MNDKDLYTIAVMRYKEAHSDIDADNLFTIEWNLSNDYKLKNIIIAFALQNNCLVEETDLYKENFIEKMM